MSNVLPQNARKKLLGDIRARFLLVLSVALLVAAIVGLLSLAPALISVRIAQESLRSTEAAAGEAAREDQQKQVRAQALIDALKPVMNASSSPMESVAAALLARPANISITTITYSKGTIILSGTSRNRQAVNAYSEALGNDERFTTVAVPVAALVGAQEGRFTVTLNGNF
jgi:Tfp pilus assembly protein PilN